MTPTERCFEEIRRRSQAMADAFRFHPSGGKPAQVIVMRPDLPERPGPNASSTRRSKLIGR
jgi:hypothetical protein